MTPGRSGTKLLAVLLSGVPGIHAEHEPAPRANLQLRPTLADPNAGLRWIIDEKLPAIAATTHDTYVETSHLYCKGFIELFFALGLQLRFIILGRETSAVARSLFQMNVIPSRTDAGRMVLLDPSDAGTLPFAGWREAGDYELCYWYALEIERRQAVYRHAFTRDGVRFAEVQLEDLVRWDAFRDVCAFLAPAYDPTPERARYEVIFAINQHRRDVAMPGTIDRALPRDLREREQRVRTAVAVPVPAFAACRASTPAQGRDWSGDVERVILPPDLRV